MVREDEESYSILLHQRCVSLITCSTVHNQSWCQLNLSLSSPFSCTSTITLRHHHQLTVTITITAIPHRHPRTHPLTHSLTHSVTHSLSHSLTHSLTHSLSQSINQSITRVKQNTIGFPVSIRPQFVTIRIEYRIRSFTIYIYIYIIQCKYLKKQNAFRAWL